MSNLVIEPAGGLALIRVLFREYAASLDVDLTFQNFDDELQQLDAWYEAILLARVGEEPAGCVALRKLEPQVCEMKRLFVRDAFRGQGIGRALALAVIDEATRRGYKQVRLDTLPSMYTAMALYEELGFREIAAYRFNPIAGSRFLELAL